jgi:hypothetical protein
MPTKDQVLRALQVVRQIDPSARVRRVGPDGVEFEYAAPQDDAAAREVTPLDAWRAKRHAGAL